MSVLTIEAKKRETKGKNNAGRLRRGGSIPSNLIGEGKAQTVQIPSDAFNKMLQSGLRQSQVIEMNVDGEKSSVIVKEIQRDPVTSEVLHIDFIKVVNGKKALLKIAVETVGFAKGVKMGGALEHFVHNLKIKAVPESLKDSIVVDVTNLDLNDSVSLKDLDIPDTWDVLLEGNPIILKVAPGRIARDDDDDLEGSDAPTEEKTEDESAES